MSMLLQYSIALVLYPGLLLVLALGALYATLLHGQGWVQQLAPLRPRLLQPAWWRAEYLLYAASVVLAALGLALLPLPWHPAAPDVVAWVWAWAAFEAAFLVPLLPALASTYAPLARAAIRAAQIGVLGRALLWLALLAGLLLYTNWQPVTANAFSPLAVHMLALIAALFAFPAAIGAGAFAAETSITPGGVAHGLDRYATALAQGSATLRHAALLAATLTAVLPLGVLPAAVGVALLLLSFGGAVWVLRWWQVRAIRLTLPAALQTCWWRALPPGAAALLYLALSGQF
ncbi:MAG: hypothetical protein HC914_12370 [Chloroflexaceae bacterium]|nr:hypothetical protein [Chloroflexaceae bacterium]